MLKRYSDGKPLPFNRRLLALLVLAVAVLLAGCVEDSDSSGSDSLIGGGGSDSDTSGAVSLSWDPPQQREDGTEFQPSEVDRYEVAYGSEPGNFTKTVETTSTSITVNTLSTGESYHFAVRVFDNTGLPSQYSDPKEAVAN